MLGEFESDFRSLKFNGCVISPRQCGKYRNYWLLKIYHFALEVYTWSGVTLGDTEMLEFLQQREREVQSGMKIGR